MQLDIYLNYQGNCEQAFKFYEEHLGGTIKAVMRHRDQPAMGGPIPADWGDKILHAHMTLGGTELLGADIPQAQPMKSAYLSLTLDSDAEADRVYALLKDGGDVFMPMQTTFFASRFAMLRDRFGTSWMLVTPAPQQAQSGH